MKKRYEIWTREGETVGRLVPVDEIERMIPTFGDACLYVTNRAVDDGDASELNAAYEKYLEECKANGARPDYEEFSEAHGIKLTVAPDWYEPTGTFVFSPSDKTFYDDYDLDTCPVYRWWDGSDWITTERDEDIDVAEVEYDDDDPISLDVWDGSNWQSGGNGKHDYMVALDDERILMIHESQWYGDYTTAEIMTLAEYAAYRKERKLDE